MFEIKSGKNDLSNKTMQMSNGQNQVSSRISVHWRHATSVANVLWKRFFEAFYTWYYPYCQNLCFALMLFAICREKGWIRCAVLTRQTKRLVSIILKRASNSTGQVWTIYAQTYTFLLFSSKTKETSVLPCCIKIVRTRIEPVGEPYREVCQSPWKGNWWMSLNRIDWRNVLVWKKKKLSWKAKEDWKHDIVDDPKGHGVIRGHCDLLYDPKGHGDLCGQFDLVYEPKMSQGH